MIAFLPLIVLGVLTQTAFGWGYHTSCQSISTQLTASMTVAFTRANDAKTELRKNPRDKHVDALAQILFGNDNAKITDAANRLEAVQFLDVFTPTKPGPYDVIIYCSTDRITDWVQNKVKVGYRDPDRNGGVKGGAQMDDCRGLNHQGAGSTFALTLNMGSAYDDKGNPKTERIADTIQLCPWWLTKLAGPPPTYDTSDEAIKKAADMKAKGVFGKLSARLTGGASATPIDSLRGFEHTLLHELTHSAVAGYSDDTPVHKCYGWTNSANCQLSQNADSLALFALGVELILHRGYSVNKDGTLQKIVRTSSLEDK